MTANINTTTGIPYGIIRADYIDSELFDQLCFAHGEDLSHKAALADHLAQRRRDFEEAQAAHNSHPDTQDEDETEFDEEKEKDDFNDSYEAQEPVYAGEYEGVKYQTTWIGGAPNLFVFESPWVTRCRPCSPCVPNAGNLENVGDYEAHGLPTSWLTQEFIRDQCEAAGFEFTKDGAPSYWREVGNDAKNGGPFATEEHAFEDCYQKNLQRKL